VICLIDEWNPPGNSKAGFTLEWNGSWKFLPRHIRHAGLRTNSPRKLAGSKTFRPKHNWTKKRKGL